MGGRVGTRGLHDSECDFLLAPFDRLGSYEAVKTNPAGILRFGLLVLLALFSCGPVQAQQTFNFDDEQSSLSQFIFTLNGDGDTDNSVWKIEQVSDAPSPKQALAILKADALESSFPMALLKGVKIQDFDASVKFKIAGGTVGQSAGLVVRAVDADHCYVLKASVHDNSLTLLKVNKQTRTKLCSGRIGIHLNHWHTLRITARGTKF